MSKEDDGLLFEDYQERLNSLISSLEKSVEEADVSVADNISRKIRLLMSNQKSGVDSNTGEKLFSLDKKLGLLKGLINLPQSVLLEKLFEETDKEQWMVVWKVFFNLLSQGVGTAIVKIRQLVEGEFYKSQDLGAQISGFKAALNETNIVIDRLLAAAGGSDSDFFKIIAPQINDFRNGDVEMFSSLLNELDALGKQNDLIQSNTDKKGDNNIGLPKQEEKDRVDDRDNQAWREQKTNECFELFNHTLTKLDEIEESLFVMDSGKNRKLNPDAPGELAQIEAATSKVIALESLFFNSDIYLSHQVFIELLKTRTGVDRNDFAHMQNAAKIENVVEQLLSQFSKIKETIWSLRITIDIPEFVAVKQELLKTRPALTGTLPVDNYNILVDWFSDLSRCHAQVLKAIEFVSKSDSTRFQEMQQAALGIDEALESRQSDVFNYWHSNIGLIYQEFNISNPDSLESMLQKLESDGVSRVKKPDEKILELDSALSRAELGFTQVKYPKPDDKYQEVIIVYRRRVDVQKRALEMVRDGIDKRQEVQRLGKQIKDTLLQMSRSEYQITEEDNVVTKQYEPVYTQLEQLGAADEIGDEFKKTESLVLRSNYRHLRRAYLQRMSYFEDEQIDAATFEHMQRVIFDGKIFSSFMVVLERLKHTKNEFVAIIEQDHHNIQTDYVARAKAHVAWMFTREGIVGNGFKRLPPGELTTSRFPIDGNSVSDAIRGGLLSNGELIRAGVVNEGDADFTNVQVGRREYRVRTQVVPEAAELVAVEETAMSLAMRKFDMVYSKQISVPSSKGELITTQNLFTEWKTLIQYLLDEENKLAASENRKSMFTWNLLARAFRLHLMLTLNHSYLAGGSPTMQDNIYYLFDWPKYCKTYGKKGENNFAYEVTMSLFGANEVDDHGNTITTNPIELFYGKRTIYEIRAGLLGLSRFNNDPDKCEVFLCANPSNPTKAEQAAISKRLRTKGFATYDFLYQPLIKLQNVAVGSRNGKPNRSVPFMSPPMRFMMVRDASVVDGQTVFGPPKRFNTSDGRRGAIRTFDDIRSLDDNGVIYSAVDWKTMGNDLLEYYNQLARNGMAFLEQFLKLSAEEFLNAFSNPDAVAAKKNQGKYSEVLYPVVGNEIRESLAGRHNRFAGEGHAPVNNLQDGIENQVIIKLLFTVCVMQMDETRDQPWDMNKVNSYLISMANKGVIDFEDVKAMSTALDSGFKWKSRLAALGKGFAKEVADASKWK